MSFLLPLLFVLFFWVVVFWGSHLFLYVSFVRFFSIDDARWKFIVATTLIVLVSSFILSSFLAHWKDNVFTRNLYTLSASWLGYLVYFVLAFAVAWGILALSNIFSWNIPPILLGLLAASAAVGIGIYWLWNAANPRVVEVTVPIKNLPAFWQGKKIVQISDVHMGHTLRQDFLWEIVDKINHINPEAVMVTGDFYDGMDGNLEHLAEPLDGIKAPKGVFYVDGNHETYLGTRRSLDAISATKTNILRDSMQVVEWLQIAWVDFPERGEKKNPLETLRAIPGFSSDKPYIFLYHQPWRMQDDGKLGSWLALFGHTHEWQLFPFVLITKAVFGQFSHGYSKVWDLNVYVSSGVGTWGPPMRVGTTPEIMVFTLVSE